MTRAGRGGNQTRRQGEPAVVSLIVAAAVVVALIVGAGTLISSDAARQVLGLAAPQRTDHGAAIAAPFTDLPIVEAGARFGFLGEELDEDRVVVPLRELNEAGASGEATLTASGKVTIVSITLDDERARTGLPAFILRGTCADLNPTPVYPLADTGVDRLSMTTVDAALDELLEGGFAIAILGQIDDLEALLDPDNRLACGEIARDVVDEPVDVTVVTPSGVGTAARQATANHAIVLVGLGAAAAVLAGGGILARRRESRA